MPVLKPGYVRYDGTKYVFDDNIEIVGPTGPPGPPGTGGDSQFIALTGPITYTPTSVGLRMQIKGGEITILLPNNPTEGDRYTISDPLGLIDEGNAVTIDGNGQEVQNTESEIFITSPTFNLSAGQSVTYVASSFIDNQNNFPITISVWVLENFSRLIG